MSIEVKISRKRVPYRRAISALEERVESVKKGLKKELIWILEHPTTFTAGIRSKESEVLDKKIKIVKTKRGGKITLHNPGQKIIYFVINLNKRKKDIRKLIGSVEKSIIELLKIYKIKGKADKKDIGIWVNNRKIAAIGLRITKWVAFHGCSINVNNNLNQYLKIIPCGLDNKKITSIYQEKGIIVKNVDNKIIDIFLRNLKRI